MHTHTSTGIHYGRVGDPPTRHLMNYKRAQPPLVCGSIWSLLALHLRRLLKESLLLGAQDASRARAQRGEGRRERARAESVAAVAALGRRALNGRQAPSPAGQIGQAGLHAGHLGEGTARMSYGVASRRSCCLLTATPFSSMSKSYPLLSARRRPVDTERAREILDRPLRAEGHRRHPLSTADPLAERS